MSFVFEKVGKNNEVVHSLKLDAHVNINCEPECVETDTMDDELNESDLYKELGILTKDKSKWKQNIPSVHSLLRADSAKIQAKALWLLGEMGLKYPHDIAECIPDIAAFLNSQDALLTERAINALGRIGRADFDLIKPYWADLFRFANNPEPNVRLSFIWASENIATETPAIYSESMNIFASLLNDSNDKVRMESPEIFRVIGKRQPELVRPYIELLTKISQSDENKVVRIHSLGAIKATGSKIE